MKYTLLHILLKIVMINGISKADGNDIQYPFILATI